MGNTFTVLLKIVQYSYVVTIKGKSYRLKQLYGDGDLSE